MILNLKLMPKMEPKSCKNESKMSNMPPKWVQNGAQILPWRPPNGPGGIKIAQEVPRWPQWGSKSSLRPPKMAPRCPKMAHMDPNMTPSGQDGPKGTQGGPKMGPRWTQEASKGGKSDPKMGYSTFWKKHCVAFVFPMKMTYWDSKWLHFWTLVTPMTWHDATNVYLGAQELPNNAPWALQGFPRVRSRAFWEAPRAIPSRLAIFVILG